MKVRIVVTLAGLLDFFRWMADYCSMLQCVVQGSVFSRASHLELCPTDDILGLISTPPLLFTFEY